MNIEKIVALINDDELAKKVAKECNDPAHDDRWCPTCEARLDGIYSYQEALLERIEKNER